MAIDQEILELSARAKEDGTEYSKKRFFYETVIRHLPERIFIGLVGPRGVGKTITLKQIHSTNKSSLYLSLDTIKPESGVYAFAKEAEENGIKLLLLDEIHNSPGFDKELKKIYDFLKINIVFTSSAAISLHDLSYDLSRRVRLLNAPPFSFGEFVFFETGERIQELSLETLVEEKTAREYYGTVMHIEHLFEKYLEGRNYPFTIGKTDPLPLFRRILETIINKDLILSGKVSPEEAVEIRKLVTFVGNSAIENMNYTTISKNLNITRYKAEKYTEILEHAFVFKRIMPRGTNVLKEPKILMGLPYRLLYRDKKECIGALREDFFTDTMRYLGAEVNYLKSNRGEKTPDYLVKEIVIEIGGRSKSTSQFKGFSAEKKIILVHPGDCDAISRPLLLAGLLGTI
ncbi:ATP-binding protein [Candidatus Micrarchaeota archaeon]|nr:ATP-binding protein [Candidatus Micrarchaeota archaeon]